MRRVACAVLLQIALLFPSVIVQTVPNLHRRGESDEAQTPAAKGFSNLPDAASGEYELDEQGSVIQITIEQNRLSGYVTKMEQETALTLFFDRTSIEGNRLRFTTRTVHGLRYSFAGTIVRGDAANTTESGFYRLAGEWTAYRGAARRTQRVSLKSTPRLR
jgi:hypothetical protein